jgi:hypothetical protein
MAQRLAIIGTGLKGAAIAAKAAALHAAGHRRPPPHIDLYDPNPVGAAWRGSIGYTDGVQPLCTLAERDLGFPYDTASYGPGVAQAMVCDFSWQSFVPSSSTQRDPRATATGSSMAAIRRHGLTAPVDPRRGSVRNEVVGVDEHQIAGIQLHRPPTGRIDVAGTDVDGLAREVTEILHDHPATFSVAPRVDPNAHVHR